MESGLRIAWGKIVPGREKEAVVLFQDAVVYYGKKLADGKLTYFEPFFLNTGDQTDETGFFVLKGPLTEIFALLDEKEFKDLNVKAYYLIDHFRVDILTVGEGIEDQMKRYEKVLKTYA